MGFFALGAIKPAHGNKKGEHFHEPVAVNLVMKR